jgi:hypothetical protein
MSLVSWLALGLALGLRHAFEADHVAAVAALATQSTSRRQIVRVAGSWGAGHALVILAVGLAVTTCGLRLPPWLLDRLEGLIGLVLVALGLDVLRRLRSVHRQAHAQAGPHAIVQAASRRALLVGGLHGLAGSAALVMATVPELRSPLGVLAYLGLFGMGSILGMGLCSLAISLPLQAGARRIAGLASGLQLTIGASSVLLGLWLALRPFG